MFFSKVRIFNKRENRVFCRNISADAYLVALNKKARQTRAN